jgi:hypothetical protein
MALVNVRVAWNAYEARARLPRLDGKRDHAIIRRLGIGGHFSVSGTRVTCTLASATTQTMHSHSAVSQQQSRIYTARYGLDLYFALLLLNL